MLYLSDINSILPSMPLWRGSWCQYSVATVNLYPQTIICNFEIALIPLC
ncbi:hypothetical protein T01_8707 [Trichinella spiralis]|uniref:Uncharacterized protein n=1 Tax=Trichinella spiralis TaxID=6334 RepID=A0A0V0YQQ4_TRISP|nr:hypothetical protein T01_8707 [Trichinella spiralis]